ncbi:hypothetical protein ACEPPN_002496 [Leptodophora sp. 'Broadleaf-Isolate-01']
MASISSSHTPSVAIFGPQSKTPTDQYLADLSVYLRSKEILAPLVDAIKDLPEIWHTFLNFHEGFAALEDGPKSTQMMSDWIRGGRPMAWGDEVPSGMLALPMLTIIHLVQYFQYLDQRGVTHADLLKSLQDGAGIQGYCGGMLSAVSVACASSEEEIVANACKAIRVAVGIGAACDVMDDNPTKQSCIMVLRLKYDGQGEEIVKAFPDVLHELEKYAVGQKLTASMIPLRGKLHNPENAQLAEDFATFCVSDERLRVPDSSSLLVKFRSNITTEAMTEGSLTLEVARTILAGKCLWYQQLQEVAKDLSRTQRIEHSLLAFGIGDCVSLEPFRKAGIKMMKLDMFSMLDSKPPISTTVPDFPPSAIAVVGLACRFPGADNIEELWDIISSGKSMVQEVPKERFDFEGSFRVNSDQKWASKHKFYGNFISHHDCFDNAFFRISGKEATYMDPQQRLLLETAYQAMESSGYLPTADKEAGDRVGVFIGASFADYLEHTTASTPNAYIATGNIKAFLSGKISHHFGWTGPSEVIDTACSSSLVAISRGVRAVQRGECTTALVGGVNFMSTATQFLDLGRASFLSPTGQCKPFDASGDGYCRSDGCGLIVLKPLAEALSNNDHIFGVIPGISTNQGSDLKSITVPSSTAQLQLYKDILKESAMDPASITYVEAHGTGTKVGDPIEMDGIRQGFAGPDREHEIRIGSIKANIGHCETAAGVAGVIKAILMVNMGVIPPMANFKQLNPNIADLEPDKIVIPTSAQPWNVPQRAIVVNSYGAAGSNAALLMCQGPNSSPPSSKTASAFPLMLTAGSKASLLTYASNLKKHLQSSAGSQKTIGDISYTLSQTRKPQRFAWVGTARDTQSLLKSLDHLDNILEIPESPKKVVLAFSGQSKQFVGLDKDLYDASPLLQKHLAECERYLTSTGSPSIFPAVFQLEPISDVVSLQCCMFAVQYSFAKSWLECGLKVDAVVGHSFGELTAMAVSGTLSLESTIDIIRARAKLIETKWGPDRGVMLVIHAADSMVQDVMSHLSQDEGRVEIACYNSKTSHVLVGTTASIANIEEILKTEYKFGTLKTSKPDTSHGFHSYLTDDLLPDLDDVAKKHVFSTPQIPLEAGTLHQSKETSPERISQHMRQPVFFHHAIARIEERFGSCIWLEAGVDSPIIPMIQRAVKSTQGHTFLPLKIQKAHGPLATINDIVSKLWLEGVQVSPKFNASAFNLVWLPPYAFERTSHWLKYVDPATEILQNIPLREMNTPSHVVPKSGPLKLVNLRSSAGGPMQTFSIGTKTVRFQSIVAGHNVISNPLCPAALYLEAAIMAAQYSLGSLENYGYSFWDFRIESPLGIDHSRDVLLDLEIGSDKDRSFVLKSSLSGQAKSTLHAKAGFKFFTSLSGQEASQFQYHQRFVKARMTDFAKHSNTETFKLNRAYRLFSRVVNYTPILTGMSSITMAGNEVVAQLDLPAASDDIESSAISLGDTIGMDNFVQVVGLLINSSDLCSEAEAFLATGADTITVAPGCDLREKRKFEVYASFSSEGEGNTKASGDIWVMDMEGNLVSVIIGMHFSKLPLKTLRKILEPANQDTKISKAPRVESTPRPIPVPAAPVNHSRPSVPATKKSRTAENTGLLSKLRNIVAEFAGIDEADIENDAIFSDLGVDSLAAIELVDDLETQFNMDLSSVDIASSSITSLLVSTVEPSAELIEDDSSATSSHSRSMTPSIGASSQSSVAGSGDKEKLIELVAEYAAVDVASIDDKSDLESLGVDSLSLIELKSALEDAFGVEVDFDVSISVAGLVSLLGLRSTVPSRSASPHATHTTVTHASPEPENGVLKGQILTIIAEYAAIDPSDISSTATLEEVGIDSLSMIELKSALEESFGVELDDVESSSSVDQVLLMCGSNSQSASPAPAPAFTPAPTSVKHTIPDTRIPDRICVVCPRDPVDALNEAKSIYDASAQKYGLTGYWESVRPQQNQLVLAYITEAFEDLGSNLRSARIGEVISEFAYLPKHSFLVPRLWYLLAEANIVEQRGSSYVRSTGPLPTQTSKVLLDQLLAAHPLYAGDCKLFSITGSQLSKCLSGTADAVKLLFGNATSRDLLSSFYRDSPIFMPATDILLKFMDQVVPPNSNSSTPFRILEVGGGTGGTTALLADFLHRQGRNVEYTFTDISSTLVTASKKRFSKYEWMDFQTLDLEKVSPSQMTGKYDLVLGSNVVHATADITRSCVKINSFLRDGGLLVLLELTHTLNWFDLVFGLLTGWWGATDGRTHALQTTETWEGLLKDAGFRAFACSGGLEPESLIQQLLIGTKIPAKSNRYSNSRRYDLETVPYKVVDDLRIEADIYFPQQPPSKPMSIALLVHGGGYMTLSRKSIRPHQTQYLLDNNILPISIDYRLCPEIGVVEGPIEDMRDALIWARERLPALAKARGIIVNKEKVGVVGWSTGGHLAMTSAWTCLGKEGESCRPPSAILSFYGPTDFESDYFTTRQGDEYPERSLSMSSIRDALSDKVITNYTSPSLTPSETNLGFLLPGDPRSELVLSLFKDGNGLSLLLNGFPTTSSSPTHSTSTNPANSPPRTATPSQIHSISPLSQVRTGTYRTPTFIIHGENDEVVPCCMAVGFEREMKRMGVESGVVVVPGKRHIFDARLKPGDGVWEEYVRPGYEFFLGFL